MRDDSIPGGTQGQILERLLRGESSAADLGRELDMTGAAVRQHLATLCSSGLVERRKSQGARGRPTFIYRLADRGRAAFPKRYDLLLAELVAVLLDRHGQVAALDVVEGAALRLAKRVEGRFAELGPEERWQDVLEWLEVEFGWEASVERMEGGRRIVLHHCPFLAITTDHPEVCGRFFTTLLERLGRGGAAIHVPICDGVRCCAMEVANS